MLQLAKQSTASLLACSACPTHERLLMVTLSMVILLSVRHSNHTTKSTARAPQFIYWRSTLFSDSSKSHAYAPWRSCSFEILCAGAASSNQRGTRCRLELSVIDDLATNPKTFSIALRSGATFGCSLKVFNPATTSALRFLSWRKNLS